MLLVAPLVGAQNNELQAEFDAAVKEYKELAKEYAFDEQVEVSGHILKMAHELYSDDPGALGLYTLEHGSARYRAGDYDGSRRHFESALRLYEKAHGEESIETATVLVRLARVSGADQKKPLTYYRRALKIAEQELGPDSAKYATWLANVADRLIGLGEYSQAEKYLKQARLLYEKHEGPGSRGTGRVESLLGSTYSRRRKHKKAAPHYEKALKIYSGNSEADKQWRVFLRWELIKTYELARESDLATEHAVALGNELSNMPNRELAPVYRALPKYPAELLRIGIEGYVDIELTVDEEGRVQNPVVIEEKMSRKPESQGRSLRHGLSRDRSFKQAALQAARKFRFAPRVIDNKPVAVPGVIVRVTFLLSK
jgi:tetratricopeptide (TPR) repeat protein